MNLVRSLKCDVENHLAVILFIIGYKLRGPTCYQPAAVYICINIHVYTLKPRFSSKSELHSTLLEQTATMKYMATSLS